MAELAGDVRELLDRAGIARAALVGLSMGGLVLMELAIAEPERWWALAFVATTARPTSPAEVADRQAKAQQAEVEGMRPLALEMAARLYGPDPDEALTGQIMDMMLATNPRGAAAALRGRAQRPDYRPMLASLRTRSLVLTGDHDGYSTADITEELAGSLHEPLVVLLKGVGHMPNLERTDDFNAYLQSFLDPASS
jgi:3-oxoadipate enol-lactonase